MNKIEIRAYILPGPFFYIGGIMKDIEITKKVKETIRVDFVSPEMCSPRCFYISDDQTYCGKYDRQLGKTRCNECTDDFGILAVTE